MALSQDQYFILRELISFNTTNPPGNEDECASFIQDILEDHGYVVKRLEFAPKRTSLIAKLQGAGKSGLGICFCGHMDTVPLGDSPWKYDPFGGQIVGDRLYGRGASDMKAGLGAMIMMAARLASEAPSPDIILVFTAGEETFCEGARYVAQHIEAMGKVGAMVICEPTSNNPLLGHKGAIHMKIKTRGVSAHASMPELGENAIYKAAEIVLKLRNMNFHVAPHPLLGSPTINVGTISGGSNINSVPDHAAIGVDVRTVPPLEPEGVLALVGDLIGQSAEVQLLNHATALATESCHPWVKKVIEIVEQVTGRRVKEAAAPYFTDASELRPALGNPPTLILGPGEPEMAHKIDEYCYISKVEQAVEIYTRIALDWAKGGA